MTSSPRTALMLGLASWTIAVGLFVGIGLTYGERSAFVHVRWAARIDAAARQALERQYDLVPVESADGSTWRYQLMDVSRNNIRGLVTNPAVEDTHYLHRTAYRVWRTAARGRYDSPRPAWVADLAERLMWGFAGLGALLLAGDAMGRWRRRGVSAGLQSPPSMHERYAQAASWLSAAGQPEPERCYRWQVATALVVLPLLAGLVVTMWREPFPISETVALMEGAGVLDPAPVSLTSPTLRSFFDPTSRSWYRPFYHLTWYTLWHLTGDLKRTLLLFRLLEVGLVVALIALFVRALNPRTFSQCAAASFAVAVLMGMPAFRENLELPLPFTLMGMPLILVVWMLITHRYRAWHGPVIVAMLVLATGFKEQGLLIVPLVVTAWWLGAPGATGGRAVALTALTVAYLAFRLSTSGAWAPFEQDFSFGFTRLPAAEASARFGDFPYPAYVYNVLSTVSNILFSEPTSGQFVIISSLIRGEAEPWQVNALVSSSALTALIAWWGVQAWRENAGRPWSHECQVFAAMVVTTLASGPLGFNYTRDRFGGMAAVFYAMAAYYAMRKSYARLTVPSGSARTTIYALAGVIALACAWQLRAIGTLESEHWRAYSTRREWMADRQQARVDKAEQRRYVAILEAMAEQGTDPAAATPARYPAWAAQWLR